MSRGTSNLEGPILVAVDFSSHSEAAAVWAARTASAFGVPLVVLHVVHDPESAPGSYVRSDEGHTRSMEQVAKEMMVEFLARLRDAAPAVEDCRTVLAVGLPPTRIVEVAAREGAQLIVVGSHGRTGLAHVLLGSKAERVAQLARVPVTIVKGAPEA